MSRPSIVLSGGGARGAYEAGVLSWLLEDLAARRVRLDLQAACGTSVGAIHAAFLASHLHDPGGAARRLTQMWSRLDLDQVLRLRVPQALGLWRVVMGGSTGAGLFDARSLTALVGRAIDWPAIDRHLAQGRLEALTVTATHVATGRPVVFVQAAPGVDMGPGLGGRLLVRPGIVAPAHVLASAAIPIVFPPIAIGRELYCEGGLRLNTPMGPAVRLGSERLFVISLQTQPQLEGAPELDPGRFPGAPFLAGKILNAFLLDHVAQDLENLERVNRIVADVREVGGQALVDRMNERARARGEPERRVIESLVVRPSVDLGELAGVHLRKLSIARRGAVVHGLLRLTDVGEGSGSDLASYLLFDTDYTRALLDLGREDAARQADGLRAFFHGGDEE